MGEAEALELEPSTNFVPEADKRPKMPEPLPVKLVAIADVVLPVRADMEEEMDGFYVGLLGFVRVCSPGELLYRADNFDLHFRVSAPPIQRDCCRPLLVEVPLLAEAEKKLVEAKLEYTRQRGLVPGEESLVLIDPCGNWVEVVESRRIL
jgi:hypothetical protein